jgi:hypothetical protein
MEAIWKQAARSTANNSLKTGKIEKIHDCIICGKHGTQMHHPDYSQPLDVVWLCKECHDNVHGLEAMENQLRAKGKIK